MGKDTGSIRAGSSGYISVGGRGEMSVRIISANRRELTVQYLRNYGATGMTQTVRRIPGMRMRQFTDRERRLFGV